MNSSEDKKLECLITETGPTPDCTIIWLHGLGADGHDFAPIVPQLRSGQKRAIRFVFPHAPLRSVTVNGGVSMRAWYDIMGFDIARDQDMDGIRQSLSQVDALIHDEFARGIAPQRLLLAGFSQGGAIALRAGLAQRQQLGGVIALSCYLLQQQQIEQWLSAAGRSTSVFMAHGTMDPVVSVSLGREAVEALRAAGVATEWSEWNMPHAVCPEEIQAIDRWIDARLGDAEQ
ncbi:MAG: carboxylesterase [Wenzhouxiangellaceae bacterium]|nr:carboxylesterase [Wenzhouxiangellaceae bacterium]